MRLLIATGLSQLNQAITKRFEDRIHCAHVHTKERIFDYLKEWDVDVLIIGSSLKGDISDDRFLHKMSQISTNVKVICLLEEVSFEEKSRLYQNGIFHIISGEVHISDLESMVFED